MQKQIFSWTGTAAFAVIFGLLVFATTVSVRGAWGDPPTSGNVPEPITTGTAAQVKAGRITVNTGGATVGLDVPNGSVLIGNTVPPQAQTTEKLWVLGKTNITGNGVIKIGSSSGLTDQVLAKGIPPIGLAWLTIPTYAAGFGTKKTGTQLSVDTNVIQERVNGSCPPGEIINAIYSNGSVSCRPKQPLCYYGSSEYSPGYGCYTSKWTDGNGCLQFAYQLCQGTTNWSYGTTLNGCVGGLNDRAFPACQ